MASALWILVLVLVAVARAQYGDQQPVSFTYTDWNTLPRTIWALVHLPDDYATSTGSYPLLVFYHGKGEGSASLVQSDLHKITDTYGPCRELALGHSMNFVVGGVTHKFIVICPQTEQGYWNMYDGGASQDNWLEKVLATYPKVDRNRIYFTGLSAGGFSTLVYPDQSVAKASKLAAIAPVSADVPPNIDPGVCYIAQANVPMWIIAGAAEAFHQGNMATVANYNACPTRGYTAIFSDVPGGDHNGVTWNAAYAVDHSYRNPNLYEWLLQYSRASLPTTGAPVTPAPTAPPTPKPTAPPTPKPTAAPCAAAVIGSGSGLRGDYYTGVFATPQAVRTDATVNFNFGTNAPSGFNLPADNFSIRWTGTLKAKYTGVHTFTTTADDGVRVYINNVLVIDNWVDQSATTKTGTYSLVAGTSYPIKVEYYERTGDSVVSLSWSVPSCLATEIIPTSQLTPAALTIC